MTQSHDMAKTSVHDVDMAGESLAQPEAIQDDQRTWRDQIASAAEEQSLVTEINATCRICSRSEDGHLMQQMPFRKPISSVT